MIDYEKALAVQDDLITRRRRALARKTDREKESPGEKSGILSERELRKLVKQAARRKAKLVRDRDRRAGKKATADESG